jgi:hypothetical protein
MEIPMRKRFNLALLMLALGIPSASASDMLEVTLNYSRVIGPVEDMATVIVGDNRIAEVTLADGGTIILTGKAIGATNLIVLDGNGREVLGSALSVVPLDRRPTTTVRVVKGVKAQDYVCGTAAGCTLVAKKGAAPKAPILDDDAETDEASGIDEAPETTETPETNDPVLQDQVSLSP